MSKYFETYFCLPENKSSVDGVPSAQFSLIFAVYVVISVASLIGNSAIIHVLRTDISIKTTTNYLILNQACADLLTTLIEGVDCFHYDPDGRLWFGGLFGLITCKLLRGVSFILPIFSLWILETIAVDRFYAETRPLRSSPIRKSFCYCGFGSFVLSFYP